MPPRTAKEIRLFRNTTPRPDGPDAVVIGSSVSGLHAAAGLAERGLRESRNRDTMAGAFFRLLGAQPDFLALALRSLVRPYRAGERTSAPKPAFVPVPLARSEAFEGD